MCIPLLPSLYMCHISSTQARQPNWEFWVRSIICLVQYQQQWCAPVSPDFQAVRSGKWHSHLHVCDTIICMRLIMWIHSFCMWIHEQGPYTWSCLIKSWPRAFSKSQHSSPVAFWAHKAGTCVRSECHQNALFFYQVTCSGLLLRSCSGLKSPSPTPQDLFPLGLPLLFSSKAAVGFILNHIFNWFYVKSAS